MRFSDLVISQAKRTTEMIDSNYLGEALATQPHMAEVVTYALGADASPFNFLMEGLGRNAKDYKVVGNAEYQWDLMGTLFKSVPLKTLVGSHSKPGVNFSPFQVVFPEKYFALGDLVRFGSGAIDEVEARVQEDPVQTGAGEWTYTLQINSGDPGTFVPEKYLEPGSRVSISGTAFEEASEGGSSKHSSPFKMRNQNGISRWSYGMSGSAQTDVITYKLKGSKGMVWQPIMEYQQMKMWNKLKGYMQFYGKGNKSSDGQIHLAGKNGRIVRTARGVKEQISPSTTRTYAELTVELIEAMLMDHKLRRGDAEQSNLILKTGAQGKSKFQTALETRLKNYSIVDTIFVHKGTGEKLKMGSNFTSYRGVLGNEVTIMHDPLQDDDTMFTARDPRTGYPIESSNLYAIDDSTYGGESNISLISKGAGGVDRRLVQWYTAGAASPDGQRESASKVLRSNTKDAFDCHLLSETSVKVTNPLACSQLLFNADAA